MRLDNAINLVKAASGLILNQKEVAFFEEATYSEGNGLLNFFGIDTNTVLGGLFSSAKEVLVGGKSSALGGVANAITSFVFEVEPLSANGGKSVKTFEHPLEVNISKTKDGYAKAQNFITDHSIQLPSTFNVGLVLPTFLYTDVVQELNNLLTQQTLIAIVAKGDTYHNMVLTAYNQVMTVENISRLMIATRWREVQLKYPLENQAQSPDNASRIK